MHVRTNQDFIDFIDFTGTKPSNKVLEYYMFVNVVLDYRQIRNKHRCQYCKRVKNVINQNLSQPLLDAKHI